MYRTLTSSSGTCGHLPGGGGLFDCLDEKLDAGAELVRRALERREGLLVAPGLARGVRDAPVDQLGSTRELGAHLAHAIAEADHAVEALSGERAQRLRAACGDVDAAATHHAHGVGMQRLGMAARARGAHRAARELLAERLGDL